jgi:hypothetical protein
MPHRGEDAVEGVDILSEMMMVMPVLVLFGGDGAAEASGYGGDKQCLWVSGHEDLG